MYTVDPVDEDSVQQFKALDGMGLEPTFAADPIDESRAAVKEATARRRVDLPEALLQQDIVVLGMVKLPTRLPCSG